jgi:hypothetical protein
MPGRCATLWITAWLGLFPACAVRPEMCDAPSSCGAKAVCVANRCQSAGAVPALVKSRRFVLEPRDVAFIAESSDAPPGSLPSVFTVGERTAGKAALLLRWIAPVLYDTEVIEAYVVLDRVGDVVGDEPRVGIHAERVVGAWDPRRASWVDGPEFDDVNAPSLFVRAGAPRSVRIDVGAIVRRWQHADTHEQALAIVADHWSAHGVSFAAVPVSPSPLPGDPAGAGPSAARGPRLELYVK